MGILQVSVLLVIVNEEQGRCSRGRQSNCSALVCQGHDGAVLADRSAGRFGRQAWRTDLDGMRNGGQKIVFFAYWSYKTFLAFWSPPQVGFLK